VLDLDARRERSGDAAGGQLDGEVDAAMGERAERERVSGDQRDAGECLHGDTRRELPRDDLTAPPRSP
jgi:hypothetical protein